MKSSVNMVRLAAAHRSTAIALTAQLALVPIIGTSIIMMGYGLAPWSIDWLFGGAVITWLVLHVCLLRCVFSLLYSLGERRLDLVPAMLFSAMPGIGIPVMMEVAGHARRAMRRRNVAIGWLGVPRSRRHLLSTECCPKCWYDLSGLERPICPECGQHISHSAAGKRTRPMSPEIDSEPREPTID